MEFTIDVGIHLDYLDFMIRLNAPWSDPQEFVNKYGGRINFCGGIDQQDLLPMGNRKAMQDEIKRRAKIMGKNGGYLLAPAHILHADVSPETVEFMIDTMHTSL
jgi:uroporphyrinogen decarboxylase